MQTIDFYNFYEYFQNIILERSAQLYNDGVIQNQLKYKFFQNTGDYVNEINAEDFDDSEEHKNILVNIMNGGGVQDSSVSIDTYVQIINLELLALEDYRDDIAMIFTEIVADYKSYIDNIQNSACQISIDNFPKYSDKLDVHGYEKFTLSLPINVIVMPGAMISNKIHLTIDNSPIKFTQVLMTRTTEMSADLKKTVDNKFYPNSTTFQIKVQGLFVDSPVIRTLLQDCSNHTKFNQYYSIILEDDGGNIIFNSESMFAKDINFSIAYGSIITWNATFFVGASI